MPNPSLNRTPGSTARWYATHPYAVRTYGASVAIAAVAAGSMLVGQVAPHVLARPTPTAVVENATQGVNADQAAPVVVRTIAVPESSETPTESLTPTPTATPAPVPATSHAAPAPAPAQSRATSSSTSASQAAPAPVHTSTTSTSTRATAPARTTAPATTRAAAPAPARTTTTTVATTRAPAPARTTTTTVAHAPAQAQTFSKTYSLTCGGDAGTRVDIFVTGVSRNTTVTVSPGISGGPGVYRITATGQALAPSAIFASYKWSSTSSAGCHA